MSDQADRTEALRASSAAFWRAAAALSCVLLATHLMNYVVFPLYDPIMTEARSLSQVAQTAYFVIVGALATFAPKRLARLYPRQVALVLLALGIVGMPFALAFESAPLLLAASCAFAVGRGAVVLAVALALTHGFTRDSIVLAVAIAFVASSALQALFWIVPIGVGVVAYLALPCAAYVLVRNDARQASAYAVSGEPPADVAVTRPSSFLPLASQMFVCLFLFRVAFGYSLRFGEVGGVPVSAFLMIVPVAAAALLLSFWKRFDADMLAMVSALFVVAGFFFVNADDLVVRSASNVLLSSGNALFSMVSWIVIAAVGARNASGALAVAAWGNGVGAFGTIVGAEIGVASNWLVAGDSPALFAISGVLLVLFVAYVLIGLKRFSFKETIEGVTPPLVGAAVEHAETEPERFARRCDEIAERFGFTPREREIFEMLARGRNREYIQEKLVVSKNTVKVHVRHIYEKSGVHSHQQLIDLVEGDEAIAPAR